jgi:hypothetical protein
MQATLRKKPSAKSRAEAEFAILLAEMRHILERAEILFDAMQRQEPRSKLPRFAKVRIVGPVADSPEVHGKMGVVLAGAPDASGVWAYTVLVDGLNETYLLPQSALEFTGEIVSKAALYNGRSVRVRVDESGGGSVVRPRSRRKSGK